MTKIYLGILLILPLLTVTVVSFTGLPQASALTKRELTTIPNDNHCTVRITCQDQPRVCGNHLCSPSEYSQMAEQLAKEQSKAPGKSTHIGTPSK